MQIILLTGSIPQIVEEVPASMDLLHRLVVGKRPKTMFKVNLKEKILRTQVDQKAILIEKERLHSLQRWRKREKTAVAVKVWRVLEVRKNPLDQTVRKALNVLKDQRDHVLGHQRRNQAQLVVHLQCNQANTTKAHHQKVQLERAMDGNKMFMAKMMIDKIMT